MLQSFFFLEERLGPILNILQGTYYFSEKDFGFIRFQIDIHSITWYFNGHQAHRILVVGYQGSETFRELFAQHLQDIKIRFQLQISRSHMAHS